MSSFPLLSLSFSAHRGYKCHGVRSIPMCYTLQQVLLLRLRFRLDVAQLRQGAINEVTYKPPGSKIVAPMGKRQGERLGSGNFAGLRNHNKNGI